MHRLPGDLREALLANPVALAAWRDITRLARNEFICWVEDAKQKTTRARRIRRTQEELEKVSVVRAVGQVARIASATVASNGSTPSKRIPHH